MASVNGIEFVELEGSPSISISSQSGMSAVRRFGVAWDDWQSFALALIGKHTTTGGQVVQVPPPAFPGISDKLFVSDLQIDPFDPSRPDGSRVTTLTSGTNRYVDGDNFAVVVATYSMALSNRGDTPNVPGGTYLSYSEELGAEYMTIPGRIWKWPDATPVPEDTNPGILLPKGQFSLAWHRVVRPPWSAIDALRGRINGFSFMGRPAGTVLFLGARISRVFQFLDDDGYWLVEYSLATDSKRLSSGAIAGWNYFYNKIPISGEHWQAIQDDSNHPPYVASDFSALFAFE